MRNNKKIVVTIVSIILVVLIWMFLKNGMEKQEKQEIANYYTIQNAAFFITDKYLLDRTLLEETIYQSYASINMKSNLFSWLLIYEQETGNMLTIEEIEEYLSQEFEEDGTRRLYVNYENENIQSYVEFMWQMWQKTREQVATIPRDELQNIPWEERSYRDFDNRLSSAYYALPEEIREQYHWRTNMPLPIVEEMVKKVYNPEYEMQMDEYLQQD